jgi:hypothetical protein
MGKLQPIDVGSVFLVLGDNAVGRRKARTKREDAFSRYISQWRLGLLVVYGTWLAPFACWTLDEVECFKICGGSFNRAESVHFDLESH